MLIISLEKGENYTTRNKVILEDSMIDELNDKVKDVKVKVINIADMPIIFTFQETWSSDYFFITNQTGEHEEGTSFEKIMSPVKDYSVARSLYFIC